MGRLGPFVDRTLKACERIARRSSVGAYRHSLACCVIRMHESVDGHFGKIRISEIRRPIPVSATHRFNDQVLAARTVHDRKIIATQDIEYIGMYSVSKGVVSLQNDRGTSYDMYIQVQNELAAAILELRDELSIERFGMKFKKLFSDVQINAIQKAIPMSISEAEPENVGGN